MVTTTIIAIVVIVVVLSDIIAVIDVVDGLSPSPSYLYNRQHQLFLSRITTRRTVLVMSATQKDDDDNDDDNDSDNLLRLATFSSADNNKKINHNNDDNDDDDDDKEEDGSVSNSSSSSSSSFKTVSQTIAKGAIGVAYTFSNILFNAVALFFVFGIILNVMGYGYEFRAAGGTTAEDGSGDFLHRIPILHVDTIEQIRTERQFDRTYLK